MGKSSCVGFSGLLNILHDGNVSDPFLLGIGQGYHCQLDFWSNFAIVFSFTSRNEYSRVPSTEKPSLRRPNSSTHSVFWSCLFKDCDNINIHVLAHGFFRRKGSTIREAKLHNYRNDYFAPEKEEKHSESICRPNYVNKSRGSSSCLHTNLGIVEDTLFDLPWIISEHNLPKNVENERFAQTHLSRPFPLWRDH